MSNVFRNDSNAAELEEVRIGGKVYHSAPMLGESDDRPLGNFPLCTGCVGMGNADLCIALPQCTRPQVIWVDAE